MTWNSGNLVKLYIDGIEDTPADIEAAQHGTLTGYTQMLVGKGAKDEGATESWTGLIDDLQIYNYALSPTEIATVKDGGTIATKQLYFPVPSSAELSEDEDEGSRLINFKDYDLLLQSWLLEFYP